MCTFSSQLISPETCPGPRGRGPMAGIISNETQDSSFVPILISKVFSISSSPPQHLQLARLLENFPREGQIRAEVVVAFYHKVRDLPAPTKARDNRQMHETSSHLPGVPSEGTQSSGRGVSMHNLMYLSICWS